MLTHRLACFKMRDIIIIIICNHQLTSVVSRPCYAVNAGSSCVQDTNEVVTAGVARVPGPSGWLPFPPQPVGQRHIPLEVRVRVDECNLHGADRRSILPQGQCHLFMVKIYSPCTTRSAWSLRGQRSRLLLTYDRVCRPMNCSYLNFLSNLHL